MQPIDIGSFDDIEDVLAELLMFLTFIMEKNVHLWTEVCCTAYTMIIQC